MQLEANLARGEKKKKEEHYLIWSDEPYQLYAAIWTLELEPWCSWKEEPEECQQTSSEQSGFKPGQSDSLMQP